MKLTLRRLDARSLGALIALFERAVGYYGAMVGINPYDQPGVEAGKRAAGMTIALQVELIERLRAADGPQTVTQLARATGSDIYLVHDILDRLCRLGREQLTRQGAPEGEHWSEVAFVVAGT